MEPADFDARLTRCPLCDSSKIVRFDRDHRGCTIDHCRGCGVRFMNPQYTNEHLSRFYSGYINVHAQDEPQLESYRNRTGVRTASKSKCLDLMARFTTPGSILMVGCGDGLELKIAKERGWSPIGYDIDPDAMEAVAAKFDVPVVSGNFENIEPPESGFDAVFMDQVIEHPKDPATYLRRSRQLLSSNGLLFLGVPNIGSLANSLKTLISRLGLRRRRRGNHYATKHHLFYYSPAVMRRLLNRFGFEVLVVRGSLKPQRNRITGLLSRIIPNLDSSFLVVARVREARGAGGVESGPSIDLADEPSRPRPPKPTASSARCRRSTG